MQMNTMIRLGALAFNVAQDEKVQELFTMIHKGARRRGLIGQVVPAPTAQAAAPSPAVKASVAPHPVPFAPPGRPGVQLPPGPDLSKYLTMDNAKKALGWAGQISSFLVK